MYGDANSTYLGSSAGYLRGATFVEG